MLTPLNDICSGFCCRSQCGRPAKHEGECRCGMPFLQHCFPEDEPRLLAANEERKRTQLLVAVSVTTLRLAFMPKDDVQHAVHITTERPLNEHDHVQVFLNGKPLADLDEVRKRAQQMLEKL